MGYGSAEREHGLDGVLRGGCGGPRLAIVSLDLGPRVRLWAKGQVAGFGLRGSSLLVPTALQCMGCIVFLHLRHRVGYRKVSYL